MWKTLIIDDEKPVRIAISKLGKWSHFQIEPPLMASNGKEALDNYARNPSRSGICRYVYADYGWRGFISTITIAATLRSPSLPTNISFPKNI